MHRLSSANQDYLETIYLLAQEEESVRATDIANRLSVSKASVNQAIKALKDAGFVINERYGPVMLTESGRFEARRIHFLHHLIKDFMISTLNIRDEIAEKEACQIEHVLGNQTVKAIVNYMRNNEMKVKHFDLDQVHEFLFYSKRLSELKVGDQGVVKKIEAQGDLKRRIMEMGVIKGDVVEVIGVAPMGDPISLRIGDYNLSLRLKEADNIWVEVL
jgi:DtxR family Mn-dependent transcriptional regulator